MPNGLAVELDDRDYNPWSSIGGILKHANHLGESLQGYLKTVEVSGGHPHLLPLLLLNAVTPQVHLSRHLALSGKEKRQLKRAALS